MLRQTQHEPRKRHDRAAFTDDATRKRHYYRARYFDRLAGTGIAESDEL